MKTDEIIDSYLARNTQAGQLSITEPQFSMQLKWTRQLLRIIELVMGDEDIPEDTQARILRTAVYGTTEDSTDAQVRMSSMIDAAHKIANLKPDPRIMQRYEGYWANVNNML